MYFRDFGDFWVEFGAENSRIVIYAPENIKLSKNKIDDFWAFWTVSDT